MKHQEAKVLAEKFIEQQKAQDVLNLSDIRKKLTTNPNIVKYFKDIKDIANQKNCEQMLFLNPLTYLFSEEYSSAKHFGIYKNRYTSLQIFGVMDRKLDLRCGRPGVILSEKDVVHEIPFSEYNLPDYFEDELVLSAFIIELQSLIPNYNTIALTDCTDSDYGITTHDLKLLSLPDQKQFSRFLEDYLFDYSIVEKQGYGDEITLLHRNSIMFYDYEGTFFNLFGKPGGTVGIVSRIHYPVVGIRLKLVPDVPKNCEPPLKWF